MANTPESNSRFQSIFNAALEAYENKTGKDISSHPLLHDPIDLQSPEHFLAALRREGFHSDLDQPGSSHDTSTAWLDTTVNVTIQVFQVIRPGLGLAYPPAGVICAAIGFLLSAAKTLRSTYGTSQVALSKLFRRIEKFIRRLETYTKVSPTEELQEVIVNVMAEVLFVLAVATKEMERGKAKTVLNELLGNAEMKDALDRLDELTQEEALAAAAQALHEVSRVAGRVEYVERNMEIIESRVEGLEEGKMDALLSILDKAIEKLEKDPFSLNRHELRRALRKWLSPPDPSINYDTALESHHEGTTTWFTQGVTFSEWKMSGSLLWVYGRPGTGKSVLTSTVIQNVNSNSSVALPFLAYFFFDFKHTEKQDARALLSSFLVQLANQSDSYCDKLLTLYSSQRSGPGVPKPSDSALMGCLEEMLKLPRQVPAYLIIDALDECPDHHVDHRGISSTRGKVLKLVQGLVELRLQNLRLFVASRPENDIRAVFEPMKSLTCTSISLDDEEGQRKGIADYINDAVHPLLIINGWGEEHKNLVIKMLSDGAGGMYLWVDCQLERIRRCHASELKRILDELPKTLDETYARILREIPDEYYDRAHRLLQCLTVAVHPLDVSQLASVLAVDVTAKGIPTLNMDARGEDEEQVIRSACSSLVTIVEDRGRRVVQFSHFSIKEFLISDHFSTPVAQDVARYRVLPDSAHKFMAHACIATLLQLDYRTYRTGTQNFPLAYYAAVHLATHAEFGNVISHIRRGLDVLLDADKPHLSAWIQVVRPQSQISEQPAPLNWAVVLGFPVIVEYLMSTRPQDLNAKGCFGYTPLHQAAFRQYIKITRLLLAKGADAGIQSNLGETPLHLASARGHNDIVQLLLDLNDHRTKIPTLFRWVKNNVFLKLPRPNKIIHARNICGQTPLHEASQCGRSDTIRLLLDRGADVDSRDDLEATPLLLASSSSKWDEKPLKLLIECGANVHAQDKCGRTALHEASYSSNLVIMQLLLDNGVEVDSRDDRNSTPLHRASLSPFGHYAKSVKLLIENGSNVHARDSNGKTPLHLVSGRKPEEMILLEKGADVDTQDEKNNTRPVELLVEHGANVHARDSRGETPLHLASKVGSFKKMMLLLEKGADVDAQDKQNNTPLHLAASSGFGEGPVKLLVEHGANVHAKNWLGETPFQVASTVGDGQAREFLSTLAHDQS